MVADLALGIKCFKPDKLHEYPDLHQHFEILTNYRNLSSEFAVTPNRYYSSAESYCLPEVTPMKSLLLTNGQYSQSFSETLHSMSSSKPIKTICKNLTLLQHLTPA